MTNHINCSFILLIFLLISCDKAEKYYSSSYIQELMEIGDELSCINNYNAGNKGIIIELYPNVGKYGNIKSIGSEKEWFDEMCKEYGDDSYKKTQWLISDKITKSYYLPTINSITVTSDSFFDNEHESGTLLNDYIELGFESVYQFISSDYSNEELTYPRIVELNSISEDDLTLTRNLYLRFKTIPEKREVHRLTIIFNLSDSRTITGLVDHDFSKYN